MILCAKGQPPAQPGVLQHNLTSYILEFNSDGEMVVVGAVMSPDSMYWRRTASPHNH